MSPTISRSGGFPPRPSARPVPDAQTAYEARACQAIRRAALEEAAVVAEWAHMVPPDGGSPTEAEFAVAEEAALRIRALKDIAA